MSQTSSTFDKAILRGFLFCLKHQGLSPIEAHSALLQFTKTEIFTVEEITELFNRNYRPKKTLFLIENGILNENAPEKFLTSVAEAGLQDIDTLRLLEIFRTVSTDPYSLETVETYLRAELDQKKLIIGKNFISGFLICLHRQNYKIEDSYEKLKATTGIEIEIGEVKKIYAEIAKGDYYDGM
uniref:TerB family tellurite resistance protein n=1 Tax=Caenorhabditis tropicalis TaxID=1561998 RepID=A0A1I7UYN9_9PELO